MHLILSVTQMEISGITPFHIPSNKRWHQSLKHLMKCNLNDILTGIMPESHMLNSQLSKGFLWVNMIKLVQACPTFFQDLEGK